MISIPQKRILALRENVQITTIEPGRFGLGEIRNQLPSQVFARSLACGSNLIRAMSTSKQTNVYILKVSLRGAKRIWRRIAIQADQTLEDLHEAIFEAFDRYDPHLYSFNFPNPGSSKSWRDGPEYTDPYVLESADSGGQRLRNAAATKIGELNLLKGQTFNYIFDFGDSWEHLITVERTDGESESGCYPQILEKRGESPPQYPECEDDEED